MNQLVASPPRRYAGNRHEKRTVVSGKTGAPDAVGEACGGDGDGTAGGLAGELGETDDTGGLCAARPGEVLAPHALMTAMTATARICRIWEKRRLRLRVTTIA
jgi:hypothetical protein